MAEFKTIFIPVVLDYVPAERAVEEGLKFLDGIYSGDYPIEVKLHTNPCCVTSGVNFDRFFCPACQALVTAYDYSDWWWKSPLSAPSDPQQVVKVPCCNKEIKFKDFDFGNHVGFARFQIHVGGVGERVALNEYQLHQLEVLLGCRLQRIIQVIA